MMKKKEECNSENLTLLAQLLHVFNQLKFENLGKFNKI